MRRRLLACLLLAALAPAGEPVSLIVLHTNDLHGQLEPLPPSPVRAILRGKPAGGFAHLAAMVNAVRAEGADRDASVLLLDAGDLFQGTPIGNETRGEAVVEAMNALRYDAVAVGNHEFDYGFKNFVRLTRLARFPFVAANLSGARGPIEKVLPYVVLEPPRAPCRIAIIGLLTESTPQITTPGMGAAITISSPFSAVRTLLREVRADLYVLLSHLGRDADRALAKAFPRLDLIVGGHSHTPLVERVAGVLVVQTHSRGMSLGRVDLTLDPDGWRVLRAVGQLIDVDPRATEPDPKVAAVIERYAARLDERLTRVVGRLAAPARRRGGHESSPAGNWLADVIRTVGEAEVGIMNKGGIRADLEEGDVTAGDVYRLMPFENVVVSMDLTGAELEAIVRRHCENDGYPALDWSGLRIDAEPDGDHCRPAAIRVGDAPLDPARTYRVATNSFLAAGGDGFRTFEAGRNRKSCGVLVRDALVRDLEARSPVTPPAEARVRVLQAR